MSWSRILRFSRERQVPVIVTDEQGEHPMVLLSLEQLEAALDGKLPGSEPNNWPEPTEATPAEPVPAEETAPNFVDRFEQTFTTQDPVAPPVEETVIQPQEPQEQEEVAIPEKKKNEVRETLEIFVPPEMETHAPVQEIASEPEKPAKISSDLSLEERFYLEN